MYFAVFNLAYYFYTKSRMHITTLPPLQYQLHKLKTNNKMKKQWKHFLFPLRGLGGFYVAAVLCMSASCQKEEATNLDLNTDCFRYGVYHRFDDGKGKIIDGEKEKIVGKDNRWFISYKEPIYSPTGRIIPICNIPKELMVNGLEISFSGRIPNTPSDPLSKFSSVLVIDTYKLMSKPL